MAEPGSRRGGLRFVLLVAVPLCAIVVGLLVYLQGGRFVETDNAFVKADMVLVAPEVGGRVVSVAVRENQAVQAGQTLLRLDEAQAVLDIAHAEASVARERSEVQALRASHREKLAEIAEAGTRLEFALRDQKRQTDLVRQRFATASRLDDAELAVTEGRRRIATLRESLARIEQQLGGGPEVPLDEHPAVRAAMADLERARLALRRTELKAPLAGVVSKLPAPGRFLQAGQPALTLIASGAWWVEANVTETDLTHMRVGQDATVHIDAYPDTEWRAEVESLSPATGAEFSILPPQNATGNWVKVPQRLPVRLRLQPAPGQPPLRAGLSAVVSVDTGHLRTLFGWRP